MSPWRRSWRALCVPLVVRGWMVNVPGAAMADYSSMPDA
jgi:hypothetical protein